MSIVSHIVGRCHVGMSNFEMLREVYLSFKKSVRNDPRMKSARKKFYREAIEIHKLNKKMYHSVMTGSF